MIGIRLTVDGSPGHSFIVSACVCVCVCVCVCFLSLFITFFCNVFCFAVVDCLFVSPSLVNCTSLPLLFALFRHIYIVSYNSGVSVSALTTNALNTRLVPAQVTKTLTPKYNDRLSCSSLKRAHCNLSTPQCCATGSVLPVTEQHGKHVTAGLRQTAR